MIPTYDVPTIYLGRYWCTIIQLELFTKANYNYFSIFDIISDLFFLDMNSGEIVEYPYNSDEVDSYHTWSSNSRWVVFSSKRIDGTTTRPFITYIDNEGKAHKPFVLPQKDPLFYKSFKNNYNVPELITGAVDLNRQELFNVVRVEAKSVTFDQRVNLDALSGASSLKKSKRLHNNVLLVVFKNPSFAFSLIIKRMHNDF